MGNYPPPPPYGGDWKYQRRVLKEQARAQRDAYRYQLRGQRRTSILGPVLLITLGVLFLLVQTHSIDAHRLWEWYGRFWPFLLIAAGVILLIEWAFDHHVQSDPTRPRYRRRIGGGVFTLLILLGIAGILFSEARTHGRGDKWFDRWQLNQDNLDEFMGDKHESDQTLSQSFPANGSFSVDSPRGDVTISGTSDDNQVHVSVHKEVYTRSDSEADRKAEQLSPALATTAAGIVLSVPAIEGTRADLTITVPPTAATTVTANHGDINVSSIKAPVQITANHGDVELSAITGPVSAHINNGDSSFSAHAVTGPVAIEGRGRDTTLTDISGPVSMRGDYFGATHFERIRGPIKFHTSRTDLQLGRLDGEIEISNNADLTASSAVGPLILTTGNRNITLDRIGGSVSVTNRNGSVDLTNTPPLSNVTIENRNGSVNVSVPEKSSFAYELEATNGSIDSDFAEIKIPEGGLQEKTISGSVGATGPTTPTIHISTSQGDVSLKKASIMPLPPTPPAPPPISIRDADGSSVYVGKDGVRISDGADGSSVIIGKEGLRINTNADGSGVYTAKDGTRLATNADGSYRYRGTDGLNFTTHADGSYDYSKDGVDITSSADGSRRVTGSKSAGLSDAQIADRIEQAKREVTRAMERRDADRARNLDRNHDR